MSGKRLAASQNSSHVCMQMRCPRCGAIMLLYLGLSSDNKNSSVACTTCQNKLIPPIPGPVIGGPFVLSD